MLNILRFTSNNHATGKCNTFHIIVLVTLIIQGCCLAKTSPGFARSDIVSIEYSYLATYPKANCTKIHIYLKNSGQQPAYVDRIRFGSRFLDLDRPEDTIDSLTLLDDLLSGVGVQHDIDWDFPFKLVNL